MRSVSDINDQFQLIAIGHSKIKSYRTNSFEEMDINKLDVTDYPILYAQVTSAMIDVGVTTYDYEVVVADLVVERQLPTLPDVYTETILIMQDVIAMLEATEASGAPVALDSKYGIEMPVMCQPFTARFDNLLTGWACTLSVRVPNALDLCNVPT